MSAMDGPVKRPSYPPRMLDAVVVGSGPNGLAAAVTLAAAGKQVLVLEAADTIGGGTRSLELTIPGVTHDICSAVHPMGAASPAFQEMALDAHGLEWAHPEVPMVHPLDDGTAGVLRRDAEATAAGLGEDAAAYRRTFGKIVRSWEAAVRFSLGHPLAALRRPVAGARFGLLALQSTSGLARRFHTAQGRALVAGLGAHAVAPLNRFTGAGVALVLGAAAHTVGWPFASGGSQQIANAMVDRLTGLGGTLQTGTKVTGWADLPPSKVVLFDLAPSAVAEIAGNRMSARRRSRYRRYRHGPGVFKLDAVFSGPIPWTNADARQAGTLHLGGEYREVARSEAEVWAGEHPERPFTLVAQPSVVDAGRAPEGQHVLWAYCHVPSGSDRDMTDPILDQVERFAPGARELLVATHGQSTADLEGGNANLVRGDIGGGAFTLRNIFARPTLFRPHRVGRGLYLCSASTPPGAGVHGMCGARAAAVALRELD